MGLTLIVSFSTFANDLDCKLLKGASIGSKAIVVSIDGYGDAQYHVRTFEILRNSGNNLSTLLKKELVNELSSEKLKKAVLRIASNIDNTIQDGHGDLYYWAKFSAIKLQDLQNATNSLVELADITCN